MFLMASALSGAACIGLPCDERATLSRLFGSATRRLPVPSGFGGGQSGPLCTVRREFILRVFQERQDEVTVAFPGMTTLVLMKRGLTLLASSVGDHSMCKMGGGLTEDWVPRNEEEPWHGLRPGQWAD